jgi:Domain of unknown function (DUF4397)
VKKMLRTWAGRAVLGAVLAAGVTGGLSLATAAPAAAAENGTVYVVHGVPGLTVDVYVNGKAVLTGFKPGEVTGPLSLPPGSYDVAVRKAGEATTAAPAIDKTVTLPAGANVSLVAHLSASGTPTLTAFANPVGGLANGKARLVVRHTAAVPAVDILAGGKPVFTGLTNPNQQTADVAPGTVSAAVALADSTKPVIGPADLTLKAGQVTVVYAVGSAKDSTLRLVTQSLAAAQAQMPQGVNAGSGGLAADGSGNVPVAGALILGGLMLITGGGLVAARVRR